MAPVLRSKSRAKSASASESQSPPTPTVFVIDDADSDASSSVSLSPDFPTPPPPPRRSLRLSTASETAHPNPNLCHFPVRGTAPDSTVAVGKRKGTYSIDPQEEEEVVLVEEGRRMTLRSGSHTRVTPARKRGRPTRANTVYQHQQFQQEENEVREGDSDGDGDGDEEEVKREERRLSLRSARGGDKGHGSKGKLIIDQNLGARATGLRSSGFLDKGKAKMVVDVDLQISSDSDSSLGSEYEYSRLFVHQEEVRPVYNPQPPEAPAPAPAPVLQSRREAQRNRAIELAPKYAFFKDDEAAHSDSAENEESVPDAGAHDWPGPFSTAMKIIEEREAIRKAREQAHSSKGSQPAAVPISWKPSKDKRADGVSFAKKPLSLKSKCIRILADNANEIESLEVLPDMVKSMLIPVICHNRKMTARLLSQLVRGSPVELQLSDCSWANDKEFEDIFTCCDTSKLKEVQLDLCGRCLPDYVLRATLARAPNSLPSLTKLSLKGAYSLSDDGLAAIVSSAPLVSSVNLCECSLLTSEGISHLADNRGAALRELYIDNCQNVNAMLILPSLKKAKCLEVLSMAGIPSVSDKFVSELIPVCGSTIKELCFAACSKLTASAIKVIGDNCPQLSALDIRNLTRLKDVALGHLANGCRSINKLLLYRSSFSDEAIAAFVEASGTKLIELSLNNIEKVGHQTAIAISRRCCMSLQTLDLSFCRKMSDQALGLMVDSCSSLKTLKLFGCTQVTDFFRNGHSNFSVRIIGLGGNILDGVQNLDFA
ncbi:F-box/LRR protein [Rhynchospora pubera]|uniref:F-box/LRR protein n=1 Tax=Rhynchospora pubera TaxID=906938 RepID=A0AAV8F978_9POAL|nr:F-box/LRR protein [Rhynchospora pubera]